MLLIFLCVATYLVTGVVIDLFFEILMIHFGVGGGFDRLGRAVMYLLWPLILAWFIVSLVIGFINRLIDLLLNSIRK